MRPSIDPANPWIIFRTSAHASLPVEGYPVDPSHAALMPTLRTNASGAVTTVLQTARTGNTANASYYRLVGLNIMQSIGHSAGSQTLLNLGDASNASADGTIDGIPQWLIADRCLVRGHDGQEMIRAIGLHCRSGAVVDSYVYDAGATLTDTQAIWLMNGPGPFKIVGNTLIGASENLMSGGGDPAITGLLPSDLEIRRNYIAKPWWWNPHHASYDGAPSMRTIKNLFELKIGQRILIEGNVLENVWTDAQDGAAALLKSVNQSGGVGAWSKTVDVTIRLNEVRSASNMFSFAGAPEVPVAEPLSRVFVEHNVGYAIGGLLTYSPAGSPGPRAFAQLQGPMPDLRFRNNTCLPAGKAVFWTGMPSAPSPGFELLDCVLGAGDGGIFSGINDDGSDGSGVRGAGTLDFHCGAGNWTATGNVVVELPTGYVAAHPSGNAYPASRADVGFADADADDLRILSGPYVGKGADLDLVAAYCAGVRRPDLIGANA